MSRLTKNFEYLQIFEIGLEKSILPKNDKPTKGTPTKRKVSDELKYTGGVLLHISWS